jgi:hypothetical protein
MSRGEARPHLGVGERRAPTQEKSLRSMARCSEPEPTTNAHHETNIIELVNPPIGGRRDVHHRDRNTIAMIKIVLVATVATPALSQGLNRRANLTSAQSGRADPGDLVMDINVTEALPNVFGAARPPPGGLSRKQVPMHHL